ncbi:MAG: NAD-dependent epimerase/dehydratase family protein [Bacteroidetes bacterium]|nr:NAD-dependent epimerase/dehydratase family protein [Bacteroidota bacterium]
MILITGATGLVGARLLFDLSVNERVKAMRRISSKMDVVNRIFSADPERLKNVEWVEGDVNDIFSLEDAFENVDVVYHSAALISFLPSERNLMMKVNVEGTANVVNMALDKKVKRFCHVSSVAALGRIAGSESVDENNVWKTSSENSNYAISKYGGEREVWRGIEEGLSAFIINPTIIIGPGDWNSGSSQMFSSVNKGLKFYATGSTGFVDYRDVSKCAIELMNKGVTGKRFVINGENLPYQFVFDKIAEGLNKPKATIKVTPLIAELGWRAEAFRSFIMRDKSMVTKETARNGNMHWKYLNEKIKKEIGIEFISIENSISHTASLFKN